jgi:hypothetical protein
MRRSFVLGALALAACGYDGLGSYAAPSSSSPSAEVADGGVVVEIEPPPPIDPGDGGVMVLDAGEPFEAGTGKDAGALPTSPGAPLVYVVSARFWAMNPTNGTWTGGVVMPTATCPYLDELAVDAFGRVFAVGNAGARLYRVDPGNVSCTAIGAGGAGYPQSLAFAPRGTLNPDDEELVGYLANGSFVRVDTQTGALSLVTAGALAGYTVGDLVNFGSKGYVLVSGGACSRDCLWEVSLATGKPVTAAPVTLPTTRRATALAHWGARLYSFGDPDDAYVIDPANPGAAARANGPQSYSNVVYRGAGSRTIAPTQ